MLFIKFESKCCQESQKRLYFWQMGALNVALIPRYYIENYFSMEQV
jgi:hypothetical protein